MQAWKGVGQDRGKGLQRPSWVVGICSFLDYLGRAPGTPMQRVWAGRDPWSQAERDGEMPLRHLHVWHLSTKKKKEEERCSI